MEELTVETFRCPESECGKAFPTENGLEIHRQWKHNPETQARRMEAAKKSAVTRTLGRKPRAELKCSICGRVFQSESGLRYHTSHSHNGEGWSSGRGDFKCPDCNYSSSKAGVNLHRSLVHGVFSKTPSAKSHRRIGRKRECSYCDFTTRTKAGLTRHMRQQHRDQDGVFRIGDKPFIINEDPIRKLSRWLVSPKQQTSTMTDRIVAIVAEKIYDRLMEEMK